MEKTVTEPAGMGRIQDGVCLKCHVAVDPASLTAEFSKTVADQVATAIAATTLKPATRPNGHAFDPAHANVVSGLVNASNSQIIFLHR